MDRFFTSSNPYIDDENSATTELEGEVDTDDENQEENPLASRGMRKLTDSFSEGGRFLPEAADVNELAKNQH